MLQSALLLVLTLTAGVASTIQPADLSGTWVMVSPPEGAGQELVIKQDANTFTLDQNAAHGQSFVYRLDGAETKTPIADTDGTMTSTAGWNGTRLVISSVTTSPTGPRIDQKETWSIASDGRLTLEVVLSRAGDDPVVRTMTYRKR